MNLNYRTNEIIEFKFKVKKSKKAKYVSLRVSPFDGLEVVVPFFLKDFNVEKLLYSKRVWIKQKLLIVQNLKTKRLLFGNKILLEEQFNLFDNFSVLLNNDKLIISKPLSYNRNVDEIYERWLFEQAENYIPKRVNYIAKQFNFEFNKIKIKNQKTRWGSCSSKKNLSFNYRLISFDKKVIDYVIIHELCHLKEMNHSKDFWKLVEDCMPDYKLHRKMIQNLNN